LFLAALASLLGSPPVGARIHLAATTDAGLALAMSGGFQLVFCEAQAEPISPLELAEKLFALTPRVPLILLGEPDDEKLLAAALHTNVAGFFTKDAGLDEFLAGVNAVLSGHRAVGSNLMRRVIARLDDSDVPLRRAAGQLSPTELEILTLIGEARSIPFIAERRGISHKTVRNHLANIYRKLDLRSRTEAMLCAARMGLTGG
jgi:DNA-binding NarL/FixJ family response regulator